MKRAVQSFAVGRRMVTAGTVVTDDDPIVRHREKLFETVPEEEQSRPRRSRRQDTGGDEAP